MRNNNINTDTLENPKPLSKKYSSAKNIEHENNNTRKIIHRYFQLKLQNDANIDMKTSQYCAKGKTMASHFARYLNSVIDQEIPAKYIQHKQKYDQG